MENQTEMPAWAKALQEQGAQIAEQLKVIQEMGKPKPQPAKPDTVKVDSEIKAWADKKIAQQKLFNNQNSKK